MNTKRLENTTRQVISDTLLAHSKQNPNGSYSAQYGHINKLAAQFNVSRKTVSKIWAIAKKQIEQGVAIDVRSRMIGKKGRKRTVMDAQAIADTPLTKRTNVRSLAAAIGKPKSTVHEWIKKETLNKVWLTYQQVLTKVMEHEGNNNYRLPHMGKDRLAREVNLPKSLSIDLDLIQKTARLVGQQNGGRNEGMVEFNTEEGDDHQSSELN
ncbi:unnamed protein product [Cuscuta campestris]|uniref:DUF7769 domain-containing protein n=1 Tax=Cuscuta campestris TaxID=132261 RepID=A0A484L6M2_9ASTE|nr:unnamed protein product [Cuscuta campestris]